MEYADYVKQISFRLFQPETPRLASFGALEKLARKAGLQLDMWMTVLPDEQVQMQQRLRRVCRLRRRSTFAIGALINRGVAQLPAGQMFLNIGVGGGFALLSAMAGHSEKACVGVDRLSKRDAIRESFDRMFERLKSEAHDVREIRFREYLSRVHRDPVGFCVCDNMRTHDDQFDALRLAEPFLVEGGLVLIDDANRPEIRQAVTDFLTESAIDYRVLLDIQTSRPHHPTFWNGVILLQRGGQPAQTVSFSRPERRAA